MEKKTSFVAVILNCFCAVVWIILVVLDLAIGYTSTVSFVLHFFCAVVWTISAVLWIRRYWKSKRNNE